MPSTPVMKARGLNTSPNQLTVEEGSLSEASNIIIRRDDVIEPRRGFKLYGQSFGITTDTLKQMFVYRERLLRHYDDIIEFQNGLNNDGSVNFDTFNGSYTETQTGLRMKSIEANGNLYFTTSEGIKKISASSGNELSTASGYITSAGGVKAVDMDARLSIELGGQTRFLIQDSAVAYRHLWNQFDANNNLIQGTPSQRIEIYNSLDTLLIRDLNHTLITMDRIKQSGSLISDGTYTSTLGLAITASASDVRTNSIALAVKLDADIDITEGSINTATASVTSTTVLTLVFSADVSTYIISGNKLLLSGFTTVGLTQLNSREFTVTNVTTTTVAATVTGAPLTNQAPVADTGGVVKRNKYTLITQPSAPNTPPTDDELLDIQDYLEEIITTLQAEPIGIISSALQTAFVLDLDVTTSSNVIIDITIPEEVTTNNFLQLFRSSIVQATGSTVLTDLTPNDEMQQVYEAYPTAAEIAAGMMTITDITPDAFKGANLYTNEATGEGATQANDLPPFAKDINRFKNSTIYANTRTRHRKLMSLLGVENMLIDYNGGLNTKTFASGDVDTSSDFIMIASHGFIESQSIRFTNVTPGNLPGGITQGTIYYVLNADTNSFQISTTRDSTTPVDLTSGGTGTHTVLNILPSFSISDEDETNTYSFVKGIRERTTILCIADVAGALDGDYFFIYSANDKTKYCFYMQNEAANSSDPLIPNTTRIPVYYTVGDTNTAIAQKLCNTMKALAPDFTVSVSTATVTVTNVDFGYTTNASAQTSGFTITTTIAGQGESSSSKEILLSDDASPAIAVDDTARSLVRVLNANDDEITYAYYLSTANTVPGKIYLEARALSTNPFYVVGVDETTGGSFSPNVSPENTIVSISAANPGVVTTSIAHGRATGDTVIISNSNCTPSIDGPQIITKLTATTFSVNVNVTVAGTFGTVSDSDDFVETSENENKPNRLYYSKPDQSEAVPLTNYFDLGAEEKAIIRVYPLRDSLFVLKEDGIYRVSGETLPFTQSLFDGSSKIIVPDSVAAVDNLIYYWSEQGITTVSEAGVSAPISRPIDPVILKLATDQYENFRTATFGVGYESDNSYYIWTVTKTDDELATICYRFNTLTSTWTTFDKTNTCVVVNPVDGKLYLGAGDTNYTEQERKDFTRYDYADREIDFTLNDGNYFDNNLKFSSVFDFEVGDVLVQEQSLTVYKYNSLLKHLDNDPSIGTANYFTLLEASGGDNLKDKLIALAQKLDLDSGVADSDFESTIESKTGTITAISTANPCIITDSSHGLFTGRMVRIAGSNSVPTINGDYAITRIDANNYSINTVVTTAGTAGTWTTIEDNFDDLLACFNKVATKLNSDTGLSFSNYQTITETTNFEAIVTVVNGITKKVTLNLDLDFVSGALTLYKAIESQFTYAPNTAGDPLGNKHFRQATIMFDNKAFTNATLSFSSDLLPKFNDIEFTGDGNGIFGHSEFGSGFFGGGSNGAPFRTLIPRNNQRCRYLNTRFNHKIAREGYAVNGITLTFEQYAIPERAYRR